MSRPVAEEASLSGAETSEAVAAPAPPKRRRRASGVALRVGLGLAVGLLIAEGAFWLRDGGSFPHLNVYVTDAERGTRLKPGASERIRFSNNPITTVRINSEGYRGAEWPAKTDSEVIVVGDSQVLGLGVEEHETFSAVLQSSLGSGALVRNLGVPTYGPPEYNAVVEEALTKRPAKTVVYVVNLANDLFEANRKNKDRHAVWDGWAVRKETAPASVVDFPGRSLLYTKSHAFFALRGYLHKDDKRESEQGFASEGTWRDIGDAALTAQTERAAADAENARLAKLRESEIRYAADGADIAAQALDAKVVPSAAEIDPHAFRDPDVDFWNTDILPKEALYEAGRLSPGDIVTTNLGESGRDVRINANHVRAGAAMRVALEKKVRAQAEAKKNAELLALFDRRDEAEKKVALLRAAPLPKATSLSPLAGSIREVKGICDRHGARLVVVALPIDVQVSKDEWAKYGATPVDMAPTKILNEDVVIAARAAGAEGFDAFDTLAAAEPGAFLDGDLHMTPKGHRALGESLAKVLVAPRVSIPGDGLPLARSWPPRPDEWTPNTEIAVRESDPAGCETKKVREWLGIFCRHKEGAKGVTVTSGTEVIAGALPGQAVLVAPLVPGQDLKAAFTAFDGATRELTVKVGADPRAAEIGFSKPLAARKDIPGPAPETSAFCTCFTTLNPGQTCAAARTVPDADCARTYGADCARVLACASGLPDFEPKCPSGEAPAGAARRCRALCSKDLPCKKGRCVDWQGGQVCM